MKHEWRKHEKEIYLPKNKPVIIDVPNYKYLVISGAVNPNSQLFGEYIGVLYSLSYGVRMSYKWKTIPKDYYEYTVYPLEGVWDIADKSKYTPGVVDKDNLQFELMIRQPDFLDKDLFEEVMKLTLKKKYHKLLNEVVFKDISENTCIQMLHNGSYDNEYISFKLMDEYCIKNSFKRISMKHREVYLTDARRTLPEKNKTVLRFKVKSI